MCRRVSNRDKYVSRFCILSTLKDLDAIRIFTDLYVDPFWNYISYREPGEQRLKADFRATPKKLLIGVRLASKSGTGIGEGGYADGQWN